MRTVRFTRYALVLFVIGAAAWVLTGGLFAQGRGQRGAGHDRVNGHEAAAGEVIVKYRNPKNAAERAQVDAIVDAEQDDELGDSSGRVRHIKSRRFDAATLVAYFNGAPDVEYAEPNYILYAIQTTPTDPSFGQLWGLLNTGQNVGGVGTPGADIDATLAWDTTTGSANVVVGVVDTGVDYNHNDLAGNIWSAPSEFTVNIGGVNITCPVGSHGFNAINKTCNPLDDNNHGTHVSGTIGARANNGTGVAGVNWTTSIMGLKFLASNGSGSTTGAINVIDFAIKTKQTVGSAANLRVLSNSWGGGGFSQTLLNKINEANAADMLFVAAAGNNGANNDSTPFYPSNYTASNVVAVAATDNNDQRASFSNYGATTVDLGAPGVYILSTTIGNSYSYFNGTSMATPHVSGAAALVLSKCALNTAALKSNILNNVDLIASMSGITVTGGRLNVNKALMACNGAPPPPTPAAPTGLQATGGSGQVSLTWNTSSGATSYHVKRGTTSGGPYSVTVGTTPNTNFTDNTAVNGTTYYYVVTALNDNGESGNSNQASATPSAPPAIPAAPTNLDATAGPGKKKITVTWNASTGATSYRVYRSPNGSTGWGQIATVTSTSYQNSGLPSRTTYFYRVTAVNAAGESAFSNVDSATTQ